MILLWAIGGEEAFLSKFTIAMAIMVATDMISRRIQGGRCLTFIICVILTTAFEVEIAALLFHLPLILA